MTMEFKVRTWVWIVLLVVVFGGGAFTYWYQNQGLKASTNTSVKSPSAQKSSVASPQTTAKPTRDPNAATPPMPPAMK